jgi:uncharacterized protein (DUF58 family)
MDAVTLLKKVRRIEIKSKRISDQLFTGEYHSTFKGTGMSFSEVRLYHPGDEVRSIDWNVTARTGTPHIKVFEEERELTVMILVDISRSTQFGSVGIYRKDFITELAAVIAMSASGNNDKVGLLLFSDQVQLYLPPKKGKTQSLRIIRELIQTEPTRTGTAIETGLEYVLKVHKKKAICFLISDFLTEKSFESTLNVFSKKHDCIGIWSRDPLEKSFPNTGILTLEDAETGEKRWIDTAQKEFRRQFDQNVINHENNIRKIFSKNKAGLVELNPDDTYYTALLKYFKNRAQKTRR